ncbi:MAG: (d)CMP kinase [Planctomycetota bacterium]
MAKLLITIDGPAASGKSTVARLLAEEIGARFLDTGAMYRAVTLAAMNAGTDMTDENEMLEIIAASNFEFEAKGGKTQVRLDGRDVTELIRRPDVTANSRYAASAPKVRARLVQMQREQAEKHARIVTEGRDQGTVAFPDADYKIFLTADPEERARRRQAELTEAAQKQNIEQTRRAIEARDKSDRDRQVGPLTPAEDAVIVDTTRMNIRQVVDRVVEIVENKASNE